MIVSVMETGGKLSSRSERLLYFDGKPCAVKVARTVWAGGKSLVDYLSAYKQPLTINVNIEFTSLVDGVIAFSSLRDDLSIPPYERTAYRACDQVLTLNSQSQSIDGSVLPTVVPTLGGIIRSLQPVQFSGLTYGYGPHQSTRDDVMIGGNGFDFGGIDNVMNSGIISAFNAAYGYATDSALDQAGFGSQLFGGISSTLSGLALGVNQVTRDLNFTLNSASRLANMVSLGSYGKTPFARSLARVQNNINQNTRSLNQTTTAVVLLKNNLDIASNTFGSLLNFPVR